MVLSESRSERERRDAVMRQAEAYCAAEAAGQCIALTQTLKSYAEQLTSGVVDFCAKNRDPTKIWKNGTSKSISNIESFGESILNGSAVMNVLLIPATLSDEPSVFKKKITVHSAFRSYEELVTDREATPDQIKKFSKILDCGHRSMAILSIFLNKTPIKMPGTDGKELVYYKDLSPDLKIRFDDFTVVIVKLTDCKNLHVALLKANRVNVGTALSPGDHALMLTGMTSFARCKALAAAYEGARFWIELHMNNDVNDGMGTLLGGVAGILQCDPDSEQLQMVKCSDVKLMRAHQETVEFFMSVGAVTTASHESCARLMGEAIGNIFAEFRANDEDKIFESISGTSTPFTSYLSRGGNNDVETLTIDTSRFIFLGIAWASVMFKLAIDWDMISQAFTIGKLASSLFKSNTKTTKEKKSALPMVVAYALLREDDAAWKRAATYYSLPTYNRPPEGDAPGKRKLFHLVKGSVVEIIDSVAL